jgi:pentatricopeptide repeat protein
MQRKNVAIIVAHPDDETLWAGGTILIHQSWNCFIACLCRGNDADRAPRFFRTLEILNVKGIMGDLDDEPGQFPLAGENIEKAILDLLPSEHFDLIITHNPSGEYTRHLRHEEVSKAVIELWKASKISADRLWTFAYEDGDKDYYPRPVTNAPVQYLLTKQILMMKYKIITETYGFAKGSWEAETTPSSEAFWEFSTSDDALDWLNQGGIKL